MTQQSETNQAGQTEASMRGEGERHAYGKAAMEQTGRLLRSLSERARSIAESLREQEGPSQRVGKTVERVAQRLESSAEYLSGTSSREMRGDVRGVIQRYPLRSLGVCLGVGLLLGAALRRKGAQL